MCVLMAHCAISVAGCVALDCVVLTSVLWKALGFQARLKLISCLHERETI